MHTACLPTLRVLVATTKYQYQWGVNIPDPMVYPPIRHTPIPGHTPTFCTPLDTHPWTYIHPLDILPPHPLWIPTPWTFQPTTSDTWWSWLETYTPHPCGQIDTFSENITFPQLRWRAVKSELGEGANQQRWKQEITNPTSILSSRESLFSKAWWANIRNLSIRRKLQKTNKYYF